MRLTRAAVAATSLGAAAALPRVLCCHGGGTNEAIMRVQTAKLRRTLKSEAEFVFVEGALEQTYIDPAVAARFDGPFLSWYDVEHDAYEGTREPAAYLRALMDESVTVRYPHAEEAMTRLEEAVERHRPDTLLGFSQGAILITLLTAAHLAAGRPPSWSHNVLVCGMPVRANAFAPLFSAPLDFPATVAQGRDDPFYEWCRQLAGQYASAEYLEFPDGHRFPHGQADTDALADSVRRGLPHGALVLTT
ncbi:hypothetical protein EMIHUDRAFT_118475 [Emiliania huxleyi CCMP1516]|uniref:Serine hydrolase domain-containing protein n=2 Tax=Emiliania huxleyi TaxID=2903 RepID=A0A0D3J2B6_EMIH1|nr:hypothetical protein EMIHUDRAFT_118475 [Emiliania huxleyi CCMP1516]EOD17651.1 hypothetical protein EMIHUDRAFT_118475 [Emiliania huxleyi CCMP1516]|eukprot:XP_005770080.1 hypothetical protein EMIHUDRAFT_118475 [Emiliania huxleyi CCMP1516]